MHLMDIEADEMTDLNLEFDIMFMINDYLNQLPKILGFENLTVDYFYFRIKFCIRQTINRQ